MTTAVKPAFPYLPGPPRAEADFYPTPRWVCDLALELLDEEAGGSNARSLQHILDPGAGDGVWGAAARHRWGGWPMITGCDVRELEKPWQYDWWATGNFLGDLVRGQIGFMQWDVVMGNPPYRDAEAFVRRSLELMREGGQLIFLLRMGFNESVKRRDGLFKEHPLKGCYSLAKRPSFTGDGKTNATHFALFLWQKGYRGPTFLRHV